MLLLLQIVTVIDNTPLTTPILLSGPPNKAVWNALGLFVMNKMPFRQITNVEMQKMLTTAVPVIMVINPALHLTILVKIASCASQLTHGTATTMI
jgi:hypothetical protein